MDSRFELRDISLSAERQRSAVETFLASAGLCIDAGLERMLGVFTGEDELKGCAGLDGNVIKCMALSPDLRGEGIAGSLVSELLTRAFAAGFTNVRIFTKPEYLPLFRDLGFVLCGCARNAVMLESDTSDLKRYKSYLSTLGCDGVIVANANPCTLGHLYLIEQAASQVSRLAVIPVAEHKSNMFSYAERVEMLCAATAHLPNVIVARGSDYAVSAATFPSYFIKKASDVAEAQAELDLDVFARHLAPALGAVKRFVGTEPADALTAAYNRTMKRLLPGRGIEVVEIERRKESGEAVSATRVRTLLKDGNLRDALPLVPSADLPYMLAYLAYRALVMELELAPKPGLVDPFDSGSHKDMDFELMMKGIESIRPYFKEISLLAMTEDELTPASLRETGLKGEDLMFKATGGINTHKGAIFAMGLTVAAVTRILTGKTTYALSAEIASLASGLHYADGTHGDSVRRLQGLPGAMDYARSGYERLFASWLPFYESDEDSDSHRLRLLLKIISEIDDSNAVYRSGTEMAESAKSFALDIFEHFSIEKLHTLNEDFKRCNLSHGGAADMLSLTFFIGSVLSALPANNL